MANTTFTDGSKANQDGADLLKARDAAKDRAARLAPDGSGEEYRKKAENAKRGDWPADGGFDALTSRKRTTS